MNGQGFMAATSIKLEGMRRVIAERAMLSEPSSRGWRSISRTSRGDSGNSSRKSMPFWGGLGAREKLPAICGGGLAVDHGGYAVGDLINIRHGTRRRHGFQFSL